MTQKRSNLIQRRAFVRGVSVVYRTRAVRYERPRRRCKAPGCGAWFNLTYSNVYWCCEEHKLKYLAFQREKQKAKAQDRLKQTRSPYPP